MILKVLSIFLLSLIFVSGFVIAQDIAYIVRDSSNPNAEIISILNNEGYSYDIIDDSEIPAVDFNDYRMILVWDERISNSTLVPVGTINSLVGNMNYLDTWKIADSVSSRISTGYEYGKIMNFSSDIVSGISVTPVQLYNQRNVELLYLPAPNKRARGLKNIVARDASTIEPLVGTIDRGAELLDHSLSNARIVVFTIVKSNYWTPETQLMFENSLIWTMSGSDRDGDGVYYDLDCNDDDASVWGNLPGYIDADNDDFGTGNLLQVCSGDELLDGYIDNNLDCNDNDSDVWQNIPGYLDGDEDGFGTGSLLQVCSGEDLSVGYIDNNLDCNDSNGSIWQNIPGYRDVDNDDFGTGNLLQVCSGEELLDGYTNDNNLDCNDSDADIWQNIPGYLDGDEDGFGTGNLLQVCSGDELHVGYINNNLDCNDNNHVINPDEEEIAYDGLDNDCSNGDLKDVDLDGYNSTVVGGTDCDDEDVTVWQNISGYIDIDEDGFGTGNLLQVCSGDELNTGYADNSLDCEDNDETINPNAAEIMDGIDQNCVNEAPVITPIVDTLTIQEGETLSFIVFAQDYDGDDLVYGINSSKFTVDDNEFSWETDFNDAGNYTFKISVRDSNNITTTIIRVMILNENIVPVCSDIPDLIWDEDGNATLDLNDYCNDSDGGFIGFGVNDTSTDTHIIIKRLIQGNAEFESVKDWSGEDWITFNVFDSFDGTVTGRINLIVNPINDVPLLLNPIENISFSEDSNLTNRINLNDYFADVDSELEFSVSGNDKVDVVIDNNGSVSFYPEADFFGEERIIFSGTDNEFDVSSNEAVINVIDANEPPEFGNINCNREILEDYIPTGSEDYDYNCELSATDFENDTLTFSVVNENGIICIVNNTILTYYSAVDHSGDANCLIRVSDDFGHSDFLFEVNVINTNDAPLVTNFLPKGLIRLLAGRSETFTVEVEDIDNDDIDYKWYMNNETLEEENSTLTHKFDNVGLYNLSFIVSDGEFEATADWDIFVGNTSEFTCSEVGGNLCNDNQICNSDLIPVKNSNMCCSISCSQKPPAFSDISDRNSTKDSRIQIDITEPNSDEKIKVNEETRIRIDLRNTLPEDAEFELSLYLYDITEDSLIEEFEESADINKNARQLFVFDIVIPDDTDESNEFYIFVKVDAEDNDNIIYYNEYYRSLDIIREDNNVIIEDIKIQQQSEELICGDSFDLTFNVKNIGTTDENVIVKVENAQLKINEETDNFEVEKYGNSDKEKQNFNFKIPEKTAAGEYKIKIKAIYDLETKSYDKSIVLAKCPEEKVKIESVKDVPGVISLKSESALEENQENNPEKFDYSSIDNKIVILLLFIFLASLVVLFYFYLWFF